MARGRSPSQLQQFRQLYEASDLGLRVLIVEDAPAVADALQYVLEDIGTVVVGRATTADIAEQLLATHRP